MTTRVTEKGLQDLESILGRSLARVPEEFPVPLENEGEKNDVEEFLSRYYSHFLRNSTVVLDAMVQDNPSSYVKSLVEIAKAQLNKGTNINIQNNTLSLSSRLFELRKAK